MTSLWWALVSHKFNHQHGPRELNENPKFHVESLNHQEIWRMRFNLRHNEQGSIFTDSWFRDMFHRSLFPRPILLSLPTKHSVVPPTWQMKTHLLKLPSCSSSTATLALAYQAFPILLFPSKTLRSLLQCHLVKEVFLNPATQKTSRLSQDLTFTVLIALSSWINTCFSVTM